MPLLTYTVPEAAAALGKSVPNLRRWLRRGLIPEPRLIETGRSLRVFSQGELEVMAHVLAAHEREFSYYCANHEGTTNRLFAAVEQYRANNL